MALAKSGIDYFPLDVTLDVKFELIEAEFGLTGFGVIVHLLQEIYGKAGYYIEWTEEVALLFARKIGLGGSVVSEIVEASVRRGMFDKEKYERFRVLTSKGIQKRYFEAVSRRKVLEVDYNILLVDAAQILPNVDIRAKNVNILSENVDIANQSKVKESKVKERKVNAVSQPSPAAVDAFFDSVWDLYPVKKGKGQVSKSKRLILYKIGFEKISLAISRYLEDLRGDTWRKPQNGSTFFSSGYIDYLDENYTPNGRRDANGRPQGGGSEVPLYGHYV